MTRDATLIERLTRINREISDACVNASRPPDACRLLPVSKTKPVSDLEILYGSGIRAFGENYVQEAVDKMQALPHSDIAWHFIGHIQSNKTRVIAQSFRWVHTLDRVKIANRLNEARAEVGTPLNVLIQVNVDQSATKSGVSLDALPDLVASVDALPHLTLRGLMSIPDPTEESALRAAHQRLHDTWQSIQTQISQPHKFDTLSMGMTGDLRLAIAEGSTLVRIGTALFGERTPKETA